MADARAGRIVRISAILVGVAVIAAGVSWLLTTDETRGEPGAARVTTPRNVVDFGIAFEIRGKGTLVPADDWKAEGVRSVVEYLDLHCRYCKQMVLASELFSGALRAGDRVLLRPIAVLDFDSTDEYSSRAANAVACVADVAPDSVPEYITELYAVQPEPGGPGASDTRLAATAQSLGAGDVSDCIRSGRFRDYVLQATGDARLRRAVQATPTVLVNGRAYLPSGDPEALTDPRRFREFAAEAEAHPAVGDWLIVPDESQ